MYVCMCVCMSVCMLLCMYTCMCEYLCTYACWSSADARWQRAGPTYLSKVLSSASERVSSSRYLGKWVSKWVRG